MKRRLKMIVFILLISLIIAVLGAGLYLRQPQFGTLPEGARLERIKNSPHYADGQFQNLIPTPKLVGERSLVAIWWDFLFTKRERLVPEAAIPSIKTDLQALPKDRDMVVWLGHSSYFLQLGGKRILIDPVFSSYAAPVPFANKAFQGTNPYTAGDMPEIDYLLISHDHWDHLDYPTLAAMKPKIKKVICPLGVGGYFEQWGFEQEKVHEEDWFTVLELEPDFTVHVLPARHFSGRLLTPNKTLWAGYALITPGRKVFFSGDSGYGPHFKQIGESLQGFDLAIMENGQYDKGWPYIHMMPEEAAQAAEDLKAKALLPGHAGKFAISYHAWDDPFKRIALASKDRNYRLLTPMIGEPADLANEQQQFAPWWESIQ